MSSHRTRWLALLVAIVMMAAPSFGRQVGLISSPPTDGAPDASPRRTEPTVCRLLEELRGGTTDQDSRIRIAKAQAQAGDRVGARAALQRELQVPDGPLSLLHIAEVQAYLGERDAALSTLLRARQAGLADDDSSWRKANTIGQIAMAQLQLGDRTAGRDTFEQALRFASTLEPKQRDYATNTVIHQEVDAAEFVAALDTVASIDDLNERLDALTEIVHALTAIDVGPRDLDTGVAGRILRLIDIDWTTEVIHQVPAWRKDHLKRLKIDTLVALAVTEARANHQAEARTTLQGAIQIAESLKAREGRYRCVGRITKALVKAGATDEASRIADTFGEADRDTRFLLLSNIAEAHTEIGDRTAALKAWHDALQAARTSPKKLRALMEIAKARIAAGDLEVALRTLDQALPYARSITEDDPDSHAFDGQNVGEIATARAQAKDISGAIQLANTIPNSQIAGDALASIAVLQAASGDVKGAIDTAEMIRPPNMGMIGDLSDKRSALLAIIEVQAGQGDVTGALATAERLSSKRDGRYAALIVLAEGLAKREREKGSGRNGTRISQDHSP